MRSAGLNEPIFPWTNFGFVSYADHHFHIGYWIYAIAYYAKYYPEWANKEGEYNGQVLRKMLTLLKTYFELRSE